MLRRLPPPAAARRCRPAPHLDAARLCGRSYHVRRLADGGDYALKHIDLEAVPACEYGDLVNEVR